MGEESGTDTGPTRTTRTTRTIHTTHTVRTATTRTTLTIRTTRTGRTPTTLTTHTIRGTRGRRATGCAPKGHGTETAIRCARARRPIMFRPLPPRRRPDLRALATRSRAARTRARIALTYAGHPGATGATAARRGAPKASITRAGTSTDRGAATTTARRSKMKPRNSTSTRWGALPARPRSARAGRRPSHRARARARARAGRLRPRRR